MTAELHKYVCQTHTDTQYEGLCGFIVICLIFLSLFFILLFPTLAYIAHTCSLCWRDAQTPFCLQVPSLDSGLADISSHVAAEKQVGYMTQSGSNMLNNNYSNYNKGGHCVDEGGISLLCRPSPFSTNILLSLVLFLLLLLSKCHYFN